MTDDDLEVPASLHSYLSGPMGMKHPEPPRGSLRHMIGAALKLPDEDRMSARIILDDGGSIGWTQIAAIAQHNKVE